MLLLSFLITSTALFLINHCDNDHDHDHDDISAYVYAYDPLTHLLSASTSTPVGAPMYRLM